MLDLELLVGVGSDHLKRSYEMMRMNDDDDNE